jgi:hypothetical protein
LAHEYGHVLWWDTFVQPPGSVTTINTGNFCPALYPNGKWENAVVDVPSNPRWIYFGRTRNLNNNSPISIIRSDYQTGEPFKAGDDFHNKVYHTGRWASALAAFSPDEDFVESFQLYVLIWANPPLTSAQVQNNGKSGGPFLDDVPANLTKSSVLGQKLQCFGPLPLRIPTH